MISESLHTVKVCQKAIDHSDYLASLLRCDVNLDMNSIKYLQNNYLIRTLFKLVSKEDLLDPNRYDFDAVNNDTMTKEVKTTLYEISKDPMTPKKMVDIVSECLKPFFEYKKELDALVLTFLNKAEEELSNTSRDVIPAKAKSYSINRKIADILRLNDNADTALAVSVAELNRKKMKNHIDIMKNMALDHSRVKCPFLSERSSELIYTLQQIKSSMSDDVKQYLSVMALYGAFVECC